MKLNFRIDEARLRDASQNAGIVVLAGGMLHGILNEGMWYEAATAIIAGGLMILLSAIRGKSK